MAGGFQASRGAPTQTMVCKLLPELQDEILDGHPSGSLRAHEYHIHSRAINRPMIKILRAEDTRLFLRQASMRVCLPRWDRRRGIIFGAFAHHENRALPSKTSSDSLFLSFPIS